jgi:putative membrane protein
MTSGIARRGMLVRGTPWLLTFAALLASAASSRAANPPTTAEVLGKLHAANQKEIEAGRLAKSHAGGRAVKDLADMLIKDHTDADKDVAALAKEENIDLSGATPASATPMAMVPEGPAFDVKFAQMMVEDHHRELAAAAMARDTTADEKLRQLLNKLIPTLAKHQKAAQQIVDNQGK